MTCLNSLSAPLSVTFAVIILGYYLGHIKILGVSLDLAGSLIVAVAFGWIMMVVESVRETIKISDFHANMKFFSELGTALFVSVIGITTGYSLDIKKWKDIKAALIGSLMVASAFLVMKLIAVGDTEISVSKLIGALCGAITTTPGLSTACEIKSIIAEEAVLGYGCAYIFGVIFTVLFIQITTRNCAEDVDVSKHSEKPASSNADFNGLVQMGFAILIGRLIGSIVIHGFSLGVSGGVLCVGIVIGITIKIWLPQRLAYKKSLSLLRDLGLVLFFVGNGVPAGMQLGYGVEIKLILYGVIMTIVPIFIGVMLYKILFQKDAPATVVAGGMTSTPALCVLMQKGYNIQFGRYSLAYVGALITIIILIRMSFI